MSGWIERSVERSACRKEAHLVVQNVGSRTVEGYSVDCLVGKQECHTCAKRRSVAIVEWLLLCRKSLPVIRASLRKQPVVLRGKFASTNQKLVISIEFLQSCLRRPFHGDISGGDPKCRLFSQVNPCS